LHTHEQLCVFVHPLVVKNVASASRVSSDQHFPLDVSGKHSSHYLIDSRDGASIGLAEGRRNRRAKQSTHNQWDFHSLDSSTGSKRFSSNLHSVATDQRLGTSAAPP